MSSQFPQSFFSLSPKLQKKQKSPLDDCYSSVSEFLWKAPCLFHDNLLNLLVLHIIKYLRQLEGYILLSWASHLLQWTLTQLCLTALFSKIYRDADNRLKIWSLFGFGKSEDSQQKFSFLLLKACIDSHLCLNLQRSLYSYVQVAIYVWHRPYTLNLRIEWNHMDR